MRICLGGKVASSGHLHFIVTIKIIAIGTSVNFANQIEMKFYVVRKFQTTNFYFSNHHEHLSLGQTIRNNLAKASQMKLRLGKAS